MNALLSLLILSVTIFLIAKLIPAIHIKSFWTAILVAVVYSVINFLLGWLFFLISLPFILITFGLFKFVINAVLLWITDKLIKDFEIEGFGWTLLAALLIALVDTAMKGLLM